jgi:anti-sigma regulatory factor (Ser/Thr protein kinase)
VIGGGGAGMRDGETVAVVVEDRSQVGEARRVAMSAAAEAGLGENARSDVGIVATEAATNVVLHAGKGELLVRRLEGPGGPGVELLCVDQGPGMPDVEASLQDGVSGKGTMGGGFGAMRRLANAFSIFSAPGKGTALVCRFWSRASAAGNGRAAAVGGLAVPVRGESACGDAWTAVDSTTGTAIMLADGLGHGPLAADASQAAVRIFREQVAIHPDRAIDLMHAGLRSTRGAAVSVAVVDRHRREIRYAGIGNISGAIVSEQGMRSLVSHNGTVGHQMRKVQEFVYPWSHGALLVLHSDGLTSHWKLEQYPGLYREDPAIIAAILYRDHARPRDDSSVVVCRLSAAEAA